MVSLNNIEVASGLGLVWPPGHHKLKSLVSLITADSMTVKYTAEYVRTLGRHNHWEDANEYADYFARTCTCGYDPQRSTTGILKVDLEMSSAHTEGE